MYADVINRDRGRTILARRDRLAGQGGRNWDSADRGVNRRQGQQVQAPSWAARPTQAEGGEIVKFRVTSFFGGEKAKDGAVHSFVVRKLRDNDPAWSVRLKEGVQEFTVTAPKPGNYLIE